MMSRIIILSLMLISLSLAHAAIPDHQQCTACHLYDTPQSTNAELVMPLPDICISCHTQRTGKNQHVINVIPASLPPLTLPLQNGKLGCTTCHDPHSDLPGQLRMDKNQLCQACHHL